MDALVRSMGAYYQRTCAAAEGRKGYFAQHYHVDRGFSPQALTVPTIFYILTLSVRMERRPLIGSLAIPFLIS